MALAGGGTGGHVFPAIAIAEELKRRDPQLQLMYLGSRGSIEERIATEKMIPFRPIVVEGLPSGNIIKRSRALARALVGLSQSFAILFRFRPHAVVGTGGYASLPPVLAARLLRIPTLIHEQNAVPGKANRLCSRFADVVTVHLERSRGYFPSCEARVVGNPLRSDFLPDRVAVVDKAGARKRLGLNPDKATVFLLGGSRGAHSLNVAMVDALPHLRTRPIQIIWMTGTDDYRWVRDSCERAGVVAAVFQFIDDMVTAYGAADLAVSRAGANTLAELAAMSLPAILVPYPFATDRHQTLNAEAAVEMGAAEMMLNGDLCGETLAAKITSLLENGETLNLMKTRARQCSRPDAAESVVNILFEIAFK